MIRYYGQSTVKYYICLVRKVENSYFAGIMLDAAYFIPRTGLDLRTELLNNNLLNNNPGIIHLLQHWRHQH